MPPLCTDCFEADASGPDGWCNDCAALRDDDPNSPDRPYIRSDWAVRAVLDIFAPPSVRFAPAPGPTTNEPSYRFPF